GLADEAEFERVLRGDDVELAGDKGLVGRLPGHVVRLYGGTDEQTSLLCQLAQRRAVRREVGKRGAEVDATIGNIEAGVGRDDLEVTLRRRPERKHADHNDDDGDGRRKSRSVDHY